jgi:hypothetical protein
VVENQNLIDIWDQKYVDARILASTATVIVDEKIEIQATVWCRLFHGTAKIIMNQLAIIFCYDAASRE